jgi:hypothetical protein
MLRNVPITIGDSRRGKTTLGSYNDLTAGRRLVDFGTSQGLDMGSYGKGGSLSPNEAGIALQQAAARRNDAPLGMDFARRLLVPKEGETPDVGATRMMLAQMPKTALPGLLNHIVTTTGEMPGMTGFGGGNLDSFLAHYPSASEQVTQTPMARPSVAQVPAVTAPPTSAVTPMVPQSAATELRDAPTVAQVPAVARPPASQVTPLVPHTSAQELPASQVSVPTQRDPLPQPPQLASGPITREEVMNDPAVLAARNRREQAKALAGVEARINTERHKRQAEAQRDYTAQRLAYAQLRDASLPKWTGDKDMDTQLWIDHPRLSTPGAMPSMEERQASLVHLQARKAQEAALNTSATTTAKGNAEFALEENQPLSRQPNKDFLYHNTATLEPLPRSTLGKDARGMEQQGQAKALTLAEAEEARTMRQAASIVRQGAALTKRLYDVAESYVSQMTPEERTNPLNWLFGNWQRVSQDHPEVLEAERFWASNAQVLARGLAGGKGPLNAQEMQSALSLIPNLAYTVGMGGRLASSFGFSIPKVFVGAPDTKEAALTTLDMTQNLLNEKGRDLTGNPAFSFKGLSPRSEAERTQARAAQAKPPVDKVPRTLSEKLIPAPVKEVWEKVTGTTPADKEPALITKSQATTLKQLGVATVPTAQSPPAEVQRYLSTLRVQLGRYLPLRSKAELDTLVQKTAQRLGTTWQPQ